MGIPATLAEHRRQACRFVDDDDAENKHRKEKQKQRAQLLLYVVVGNERLDRKRTLVGGQLN